MMPKPKQSKANNNHNNEVNKHSAEEVLYESQPNMLLYSDNFIFKIIVLFILVFMFSPILAVVYRIQSTLQANYQLQFVNMTFIAELILFLCILIIVVKLILDYLDWKNTIYTLTDKRIIIKRGLFNKEKITMPYLKVQDIDISQSLLERILGAGDIIIYGGHDNTETILDDIPNPREVEEIILNQVNSMNYSYNQTQIPQGYNNYDDNLNNGRNYNNSRSNYNNISDDAFNPTSRNAYEVNHGLAVDYKDNHNPKGNYYNQHSSSNSYSQEDDYKNSSEVNQIDNPAYSHNSTLDEYFDEYEDSRAYSNVDSNTHYFNNENTKEYSDINGQNADKKTDKSNKKLNKDELLSLNKRKFKK